MKILFRFIILFSPLLLNAQVGGDLDISFSYNGFSQAVMPDLQCSLLDMLLDTNSNKIFGVGEAGNKPAISSLNQDGSLDDSFGENGVFRILNVNGSFRQVAQQSDGKLILVGRRGFQFFIARVNLNGTLDTSFGEDQDGTITQDMGFPVSTVSTVDWANDVHIFNDGKILVAGWAEYGTATRLAFIKLNSDGTFDTSFGTDGKKYIDLTDEFDEFAVPEMMVDDEENIYLAGSIYDTDEGEDTRDIFVVKLDSEGEFVSSFGSNGIVFVDIDNSDFFSDFSIDANDNILLLGRSQTFGSGGTFSQIWTMKMNRYTGVLDDSYANNGISYYSIINVNESSHEYAKSIIVKNDTYYIGGNYRDQGSSTFSASYIAKLNLDGTLDVEFADGGVAIIGTTINATNKILEDEEGRILVGGIDTVGPNSFRFARVFTEASLSINDFNSSDLNFYPNPVVDYLDIQNLEKHNLKDVNIYSLTGELISKNPLVQNLGNSISISMSFLNTGYYFIQLNTKSGKGYSLKVFKK